MSWKEMFWKNQCNIACSIQCIHPIYINSSFAGVCALHTPLWLQSHPKDFGALHPGADSAHPGRAASALWTAGPGKHICLQSCLVSKPTLFAEVFCFFCLFFLTVARCDWWLLRNVFSHVSFMFSAFHIFSLSLFLCSFCGLAKCNM